MNTSSGTPEGNQKRVETVMAALYLRPNWFKPNERVVPVPTGVVPGKE